MVAHTEMTSHASSHGGGHGNMLVADSAQDDADGVLPALSCLISQHDEVHLVEAKFGHHAWQTEVVHFLHSVKVQIFAMVLLALDIIIILVEIFLDMEFPSCRIITRDATSCCNVSYSYSGVETAGRLLAGADLCDAGLVAVPEFRAGCDYHQHEAVHVAHDVLLWLSVAILSIFGLELIILFGIECVIFLRNPLYVLDAMVIASALGIELYIKTADSSTQELSTITMLLILSRSWRFIRIGRASRALDPSPSCRVGRGARCPARDCRSPGRRRIGVHTRRRHLHGQQEE